MRFLRLCFSLNLDDPGPPGRVLAYDSGSSAKLIRLLGVDRPELDAEADADAAARALRTLLTISGMLTDDILEEVVVVVEADIAEDTEGVVEARESSAFREGVPGIDWLFEFFIALCLGGKGACVEDECVPFVNNLEIDAVAVDVPASGTGAGVRGMNLGGFSLSLLRNAVT